MSRGHGGSFGGGHGGSFGGGHGGSFGGGGRSSFGGSGSVGGRSGSFGGGSGSFGSVSRTRSPSPASRSGGQSMSSGRYGGGSMSPSRYGGGGRSMSPGRYGGGGRSMSPSRGGGYGGRYGGGYGGRYGGGYGGRYYRPGGFAGTGLLPLWFSAGLATSLLWYPGWFNTYYGFPYYAYSDMGYYELTQDAFQNQQALENTIAYYQSLPENEEFVQNGLVLVPDVELSTPTDVPKLRWVSPVNQ